MSTTVVDKAAKKIAPVVRRGLLVGAATHVRLFSIDDDGDAELWSTELSRESDAELLAAEMAGAAEDEMEATGVVSFRVRCYSASSECCAETVFHTGKVKSRTAGPDVVGDALMPRGHSKEDSLTRQAMRQAETAWRMLAMNNEKQATLYTSLVESLAKQNAELTGKLHEANMSASAAIKAEQAHEIELLKTGAEIDALKEGVGLIKQIGPRLADYFSGANHLHPLLPIVAKLDPDKVKMLVSGGVITEEEGKTLEKSAEAARKQVAKALPAKANGKVGN